MPDKLTDRVKHFQKIFGLTNWNITVVRAINKDGEHSARTLADPRYHQATITFYLGIDESTVDDIIVHELIHVVMAMYDYFADNLGKEGTDNLFFIAREKSVSELTHIFMRVLNNGTTNNQA